LFLASVGALLAVRLLTPQPGPSEPDPTRADYRITDVHLREEGAGGVSWKLDADEAQVFDRAGKTIMRNVTITIEQPGRSWTVTGREGDLEQATKDVELRGNVVLVSSDGLRLETRVLRWDAEERRAWTTEAVTVFRAGVVVRGQGLEARIADRAATVGGPVRATFQRTAADAGSPR
jgi:LPS export ABC transporter protein LptC